MLLAASLLQHEPELWRRVVFSDERTFTVTHGRLIISQCVNNPSVKMVTNLAECIIENVRFVKSSSLDRVVFLTQPIRLLIQHK